MAHCGTVLDAFCRRTVLGEAAEIPLRCTQAGLAL